MLWCNPAQIDKFIDCVIFNTKTIVTHVKEFIDLKLVNYLKHEFDFFHQNIHAQLCERRLNEAIDKTIQEYLTTATEPNKICTTAQEILDQIEVLLINMPEPFMKC